MDWQATWTVARDGTGRETVTASIGSTGATADRSTSTVERLDTGPLVGAATLGLFGAWFSWRLDRLPRLAAASAATGVLGGGLAVAVVASGSPWGDRDSRLQAAAGGALVGASAGALLLGALGGIVLPPMSSVTRLAAMREFALYGMLAGGLAGSGAGIAVHAVDDRVG